MSRDKTVMISPENVRNLRFKAINTPLALGTTVTLRFLPGREVAELFYTSADGTVTSRGISELRATHEQWKAAKSSVNFLTNRFGKGKNLDDKEYVRATYLKFIGTEIPDDPNVLENVRHVANLKRMVTQFETRLGRNTGQEEKVWEGWVKQSLAHVHTLIDLALTRVALGDKIDLKKPSSCPAWLWGKLINETSKSTDLLGDIEPSKHESWGEFLFSSKIGTGPYLTGEELSKDIDVPKEFAEVKRHYAYFLGKTKQKWKAIPGSTIRDDGTDPDSAALNKLKFYLPPLDLPGLLKDKDEKSFDFETWCPKTMVPKRFLAEPENLDYMRAAFMYMFLVAGALPRKECFRLDKTTQPLRVLMGSTAYEELTNSPTRPEVKFPDAKKGVGLVEMFQDLLKGNKINLRPKNRLLDTHSADFADYVSAMGAKITTADMKELFNPSPELAHSESQPVTPRGQAAAGSRTPSIRMPEIPCAFLPYEPVAKLTTSQFEDFKKKLPKVFYRRSEKERKEQQSALPGMCKSEIALLRSEYAVGDAEILAIATSKAKGVDGLPPRDKLCLAIWALYYAPGVIRINLDDEDEEDLG